MRESKSKQKDIQRCKTFFNSIEKLRIKLNILNRNIDPLKKSYLNLVANHNLNNLVSIPFFLFNGGFINKGYYCEL